MKKRPQIEIDHELSILYGDSMNGRARSYIDVNGKTVRYQEENTSLEEPYDWYKTWKKLRYNKQP